ncbi:MAG: PAS domain S-box protein, partial [Planctomycetes bacterium]|nr:PAS domain S-box protein [Planctomycetota bacterium]
FILDDTGRILELNEAASRYLAYEREELLGKNLATIFPADQAAFVSKHLKIVLSEGQMSFECQQQHKDGHLLPVEIIATRFVLKGEKRICTIVRDLTERKAAETMALKQREAMLQADKMISLGTLVSGVAHEINNPLAALSMNAPILERFWADALPVLRAAESEQGPHHFDGLPLHEMEKALAGFQKDIRDCTKRIEVIVQSLRTYARQGTSPEQERLELNAVVQNILPLLRHQIDKSTCRFEEDLWSAPLSVRGNFVRLEQVVMNLVQNACQALPNRNCRVLLRTRLLASENEVLLEVEDEGQGIPPENVARIFDPFFTTKHKRGGTGLGLSIVQGIVQKHGGRIEVKSTLKKGTAIGVYLPLFEEKPA